MSVAHHPSILVHVTKTNEVGERGHSANSWSSPGNYNLSSNVIKNIFKFNLNLIKKYLQVRWARTFCKFRMVDRKLWGPAQKRIHQNKLETTERMKGHIWGGAHQGQNYLWVLNSSRILSPNIVPEHYPEYYLWILNSSGIFCCGCDLTRLGWSKLLAGRLDHQGQPALYQKYVIRIFNLCTLCQNCC